jgi:hypothetical protein
MKLDTFADDDRTIRSLAASTGQHGTKHVPVRNWDNPSQVLNTLEALGFGVPTGVKAAAASNSPLGPFKIYLHDLDAKLNETTLDTRQRIALKTAADRHGLIKVLK